jgi:hypothetical protein
MNKYYILVDTNVHKSNKKIVILKIAAAFLGIVTISFVASLNNSSLLTATAQEQSQTSGNQSAGPILPPVTKEQGSVLPETFREAMSNSGFNDTGNASGSAGNEVTNSLPSSSTPLEMRLMADDLKIMAERNRSMADELDGLASTLMADDLKIMAERNRSMADELDGLAAEIETMVNQTNTTQTNDVEVSNE